jgi:transposase
MSRHFWLDDEQWAIIEPLLPQVHTGPERVDDRRIISGRCQTDVAVSGAAKMRRAAREAWGSVRSASTS